MKIPKAWWASWRLPISHSNGTPFAQAAVSNSGSLKVWITNKQVEIWKTGRAFSRHKDGIIEGKGICGARILPLSCSTRPKEYGKGAEEIGLKAGPPCPRIHRCRQFYYIKDALLKLISVEDHDNDNEDNVEKLFKKL